MKNIQQGRWEVWSTAKPTRSGSIKQDRHCSVNRRLPRHTVMAVRPMSRVGATDDVWVFAREIQVL
jgi:hypothetical protein